MLNFPLISVEKTAIVITERESDDEEMEFTESKCTCAICRTMNNIYNIWETLEITSPYEILLKQHIENMC